MQTVMQAIKLARWTLLLSNTRRLACYVKHRISQMNFSTLWHLMVFLQSACFFLCKTSNRSDKLFYPLTFDDSFAINLVWEMIIDIDYIFNVWFTCLICLMCRLHNNSDFKAIGRQSLISMMMMRFIHLIWCWYNEVDRKRAHSSGKED